MAKSDGFFSTALRATFQPTSLFSLPAAERSAWSPVWFAIVVGLISSAATLLWGVLLGGGRAAGSPIVMVALSPLLTLVSVYGVAAVIHLALRVIRGAQRPFQETLSCVCYSSAPSLFAVVPLVGGPIGSIWGLVVLVVALKHGQATSGVRAAIAVLSGPFGFVALALFLRAGVVEAFKIPAGSMSPTLMIGDHVFVNKYTYGPLIPWTDSRLWTRLPPGRGDVMVFKFPEKVEQDFIKRAIALPGDTLEVIDGRPILDGWLVPHCYVGPYKTEGHTAHLYVEYLEEKSYLTLFEERLDDSACTTSEDCGTGNLCKAGVCGSMIQGPFKVADGEVWVMGDNRNNSHDSRSWHGGKGGGVPFANIKGRAAYVWMSFAPGGGVVDERMGIDIPGPPVLSASQAPALRSALDACLAKRPDRARTTPPSREP